MVALVRFRMCLALLALTVTPLAATKGEAVGTWQGMLPCPDCRGIRLRVTLRCEGENCTYSMVESYLGTRNGEITNPLDGVWSIDKGRPGNPEAVIYRLDPEIPERSRNFLREGDTLRQLDRLRNDLEPKDKYTLRKVK